jgi:hypothetical protein
MKVHATGASGTAWIVDDMFRLGPDAPAETGTSISIEAARGEYVAVQPVIRATRSALTNVRVTASDLIGPGTISAENIEVYRENFINVSTSTPHAWASQPLPPGMYPDGLIPTKNPADGNPIPIGAALRAQNYTINAGNTQPYWVDIFVPRTVLPGNYTGTIAIRTDQGEATLTIALRVWKFTLPNTPSLKSSFGMFLNNHTQQDYIELLKHRLMPTDSPPAYDSSLQQFGMSLGNLGFFSQTGQPTCTMTSSPPLSTLQSAKNNRSPGLSLYNYTADEIGACSGLSKIKEWAQSLHSIGIRQLITMPPRSDLYGSVDIWGILPLQFVNDHPDVGTVNANGGEIWSYTALNQDDYSPKWQIDFSPTNYRIYGMINQSVGATGLLYWTVDKWSNDPWAILDESPGDGFLVYPGQKVGLSTIVPSMRLKYIRAGVQDYEYVELLSNAGQRTWALQTIRPISQDWQHWSNNPDQLRSVRHALAVKLDSVTK